MKDVYYSSTKVSMGSVIRRIPLIVREFSCLPGNVFHQRKEVSDE